MITKGTHQPVLRPPNTAQLTANGTANTAEIALRKRMANNSDEAGPIYPMLSGNQPFDIMPTDVLVKYKDDRTGYKVFSTVNGFGDSSKDIEEQRQKLVFAGIAGGQGVRIPPSGVNGPAQYPSLLLSVQLTGVDRLINTGPDSIEINDRLYWDLPDPRNYFKDETLGRIPLAIKVYKPDLSIQQKGMVKACLSSENNLKKAKQKSCRVDQGAVKIDNVIMFLIEFGKRITASKSAVTSDDIRRYLYANGNLSFPTGDLDSKRDNFLDELFRGVLAVDKDKKDRIFATAIHKAPSQGNAFHAEFHAF